MVAALLLLLIGFTVPGMRFLPYLGIASLIALPAAYHLAVIVGELRKVPGLGVSPDNQSVPLETARIILAKIRQRMTRKLNARIAAQHVATVFESLNARPPSAGTTVGLLSLHAFGFMLAIVALGVAVVLHNPTVLLRHGPKAPEYVVTPDQIESGAQPPAGPRNILVMRFKNTAIAHMALGMFPPSRFASRVGQTVFVEFARTEGADQRAAFDHYEKTADDIFVESGKMHANVEMSFKLPSDEKGDRIFEELMAYFSGSRWGLIPPWASSADWPAGERASQAELRRLVMELQKTPEPDARGGEKLGLQISAAERRGDTAEVERLAAQSKAAAEAAERLRLQRLQERFGHGDFIRKWTELQEIKDWGERDRQIKRQIAPQLGQGPSTNPNPTAAIFGYAYENPVTGKHVSCRFSKTDIGLPAMTQWLFSHGATDVHYRIFGLSTVEAEEDPNDDQ